MEKCENQDEMGQRNEEVDKLAGAGEAQGCNKAIGGNR